MKIILASGSPRRHELLKNIFDEFIIIIPEIEESLDSHLTLEKAIEHISLQKALATAEKARRCIHNEKFLIIAADTMVVLDDTPLGKPASPDDAQKMLHALQGRSHEVITGYCILSSDERCYVGSESSLVSFSSMSDEEIAGYIKTKEPMDKAGAYGIQGYGSQFVKSIRGDFFNIMGLPINKLRETLIQNFYDDIKGMLII